MAGSQNIEIDDPRFGAVRWSKHEGMWEANVITPGGLIEFSIAGPDEPDEKLISRARDIVQRFPDFQKTMTGYLIDEVHNRLTGCAKEIHQLVIKSITLPWPEQPNDGMVFFGAVHPIRVWRCFLRDGRPYDLGFDD